MYSDELITWLLDATADVVDASPRVSLSNPAEQIDIADRGEPPTYPFIGAVPISLVPISGGLGNADIVATDVHDENGFEGVEKTLRREFSIEITPVTDDDSAARDRFTDAVMLGFAERADRGDIPDDITDFSVDDGTPSGRTESFVRANGVEVTGVLHTRRDVDLAAVETVNWTVESEGTATPQTQ